MKYPSLEWLSDILHCHQVSNPKCSETGGPGVLPRTFDRKLSTIYDENSFFFFSFAVFEKGASSIEADRAFLTFALSPLSVALPHHWYPPTKVLTPLPNQHLILVNRGISVDGGCQSKALHQDTKKSRKEHSLLWTIVLGTFWTFSTPTNQPILSDPKPKTKTDHCSGYAFWTFGTPNHTKHSATFGPPTLLAALGTTIRMRLWAEFFSHEICMNHLPHGKPNEKR